MKIPRILFLLGFLTWTGGFFAQNLPASPPEFFAQLEQQLSLGNKQTIRDLATFLDNPALAPDAFSLIREYTIFTDREIDLRRPVGRQQMLNFYYENEQKIKFSDLLNVFYITPVEQMNASYDQFPMEGEIFPEGSYGDLELHIADLITQIRLTGRTANLYEAREHILDTLKTLKNPDEKILIRAADLLSYFRDAEGFQSICSWVERGLLSAQNAAEPLAKLTNLALRENNNFENLIFKYKHWLDSLKTIPALREAGYQRLFGFRKNFFEEDVDYFGRILSRSQHFWWIQHNAILDLIETRHPRSLFYLASIPFKSRRYPAFAYFKSLEIYQLLNNLTRTQLAVQGIDGMVTTEPEFDRDGFALRNFLFYWASRHTDFKWDEGRGHFVDQIALEESIENFDRLFRRLNAPNDSVAIAAYRALLESPPAELKEMLRRYKTLILEINPALPDWKYDFLEVLNELVSYCQKNDFSYRLDAAVEKLTQRLTFARSEKERFDIENELVSRLDESSITGFEIWACFQYHHAQNALSTGRIIRLWYAANFCLFENDARLGGLFLKKAALFEKTGASGLHGHYADFALANRLCLDNFLKKVKPEEGDCVKMKNKISFFEFFERDPKGAIRHFEPRDSAFLKTLMPPDSLADFIQNEYLKNRSPQLSDWLQMHPAQAWTPLWMNLSDDENEQKNALKNLAKIYRLDAEMPLPDLKNWKSWWAKSKNSPQKLEQLIYRHYKKNLGKDDFKNIAVATFLADSESLTEKDKRLVLKIIRDQKLTQDLWKIKFTRPLHPEKDLSAFESLPLRPSELDDVARLFDPASFDLLLPFLFQKTDSLPVESRAVFFNEMLRWVQIRESEIVQSISQKNRQQLEKILQDYLDEGLFISESEETVTLAHLGELQTAGLPFAQKIEVVLQLSPNPDIRENLLNTLFAKISYENIGTALAAWEKILEMTGREPRNFIHLDFGIPFFETRSAQARALFLTRYGTLKKPELYRLYLEEFGVDFLDARRQPDLKKIIYLLENEFVVPFAGSGGLNRFDFLFGLIKYLEFHFQTNLGFPEKLNENQTFYVNTPLKRAEAWLVFLKNKTG